MKTKVRKLFQIVFAALLAGCLSGCSDQAGQTPPPPSPSAAIPEQKVDIEIAQWSVPSKLLEEAVKRYNASGSIHVSVLNIPLDRYVETINMLNASGSGPDVYEVVREWLKSYIQHGWLIDVTPYADPAFLSRFPAWALQFETDPSTDDALYSLPSNLITYRLIYNKDLFRGAGLDPDSPPKTMQQLVHVALAISNRGIGERKYGFALPMGAEWFGFVQPMEASCGYSGVYFFDFRSGKYDLEAYGTWLQAIQEIDGNGGMFPGMDTMKPDLALLQFQEGNIGMMFAASWQVSALFNESKPSFDWGVAMPPALDMSSVGKGAIGINTAGWNVINSHTGHLNEAIDTWKFLYSQDYLNGILKSQSGFPIVGQLLENVDQSLFDPEFLQFLPGAQDAIYPNTPLNLDEWSRKDIYASVLLGTDSEAALENESIRLDSMLRNSLIVFDRTSKNYLIPAFDPRAPMVEQPADSPHP